METTGYLREHDGRFEFHYEKMGLVVRGTYAEWVLEAAAEVIARTEKLQMEGQIEELATLCEFGEATDLDVDSARFDANARFEVMPQCIVSMGTLDYKWTAPEGRPHDGEGFNGQPIRRIHDMSLTRNDSFLKNEDGVEMSGE